MATEKLTDTKIDLAKATGEEFALGDDGELFLITEPNDKGCGRSGT